LVLRMNETNALIPTNILFIVLDRLKNRMSFSCYRA